jgi:hypothetical protein
MRGIDGSGCYIAINSLPPRLTLRTVQKKRIDYLLAWAARCAVPKVRKTGDQLLGLGPTAADAHIAAGYLEPVTGADEGTVLLIQDALEGLGIDPCRGGDVRKTDGAAARLYPLHGRSCREPFLDQRKARADARVGARQSIGLAL